jgi:hypothetical protein
MLTSSLRMMAPPTFRLRASGFGFARNAHSRDCAFLCGWRSRRQRRYHGHERDFRGDVRRRYGHVHRSCERFDTL